jgi:lipopolysaccharide export LptBFGC system permease protein LptF
MMPVAAPRRRWPYYAACLWAVCFAAPHTWWALGSPFGFPGGPTNHRLWMESWWRYLYDLIVILLGIVGAVVALALQRTAARGRSHRVFVALAGSAGVALTLRGLAGLIVDGRADPIWWPTFLVGGLLFSRIAWLSGRRRVPTGNVL